MCVVLDLCIAIKTIIIAIIVLMSPTRGSTQHSGFLGRKTRTEWQLETIGQRAAEVLASPYETHVDLLCSRNCTARAVRNALVVQDRLESRCTDPNKVRRTTTAVKSIGLVYFGNAGAMFVHNM